MVASLTYGCNLVEPFAIFELPVCLVKVASTYSQQPITYFIV